MTPRFPTPSPTAFPCDGEGVLLTPKLLPRYAALTPERFVYDTFEDVGITAGTMLPDVGVVRSGQGKTPAPRTAIIEATLRLPTEMPGAVPHVTVEIRDAENRTLVTSIEVLSPTNNQSALEELNA